MPSISQISKQYSKQKSAQKGGGLMEFLGIGKSEEVKPPQTNAVP